MPGKERGIPALDGGEDDDDEGRFLTKLSPRWGHGWLDSAKVPYDGGDIVAMAKLVLNRERELAEMAKRDERERAWARSRPQGERQWIDPDQQDDDDFIRWRAVLN